MFLEAGKIGMEEEWDEVRGAERGAGRHMVHIL